MLISFLSHYEQLSDKWRCASMSHGVLAQKFSGIFSKMVQLSHMAVANLDW